ncbi:hypothetical protein LIER_13262 [Lithospermum erythrorhizon]|uniref:Reverse transcriptase/retrotransposon-derived protein RNase H-like domain-containing protein n=1 Tax=Lithospermum erythrorhizon TaxID=34254 RepID=A0AAV3PV84_LITER
MRKSGLCPSMKGIPAKGFKIGTMLGAEHEAMRIRVLKEYQDIFAWEPKDMPMIDLEPPVAGDVLQLYLVVSKSALNNVLIREEDKVQKPVYYVSRVMRGAETRERNQEADRLSQLAMAGFETLPETTVVEWVEEEAFQTKEVKNNDRGSTQRSSGGKQDIEAKSKLILVTYELETLERRQVPRSCNACHLRLYYV